MVMLDSAQKVVHVTLHGTMLNGGEIWQTGFYMGNPEQDANVPNQAFADAVRDAWIPLWSSNTGPFCYSYKFEGVKAVRLAKNGLYDGTDVAESFPAAAVAGGYPGAPLPPQCSLVATLIGGSGKGLGGKGRMYLPGVSWGIGADGRLTTGNTDRIATDIATFLDNVNSSIEAPGVAINVSRGHKAQLGLGARNVIINGVRVGNVYDTQRRRRDALTETYSAHVVG